MAVGVAVIVVVAILAVWGPWRVIGFFQTNYLYHLGHKRQWREVHNRLDTIPAPYQSQSRFERIRLETLLHLSMTEDFLASLGSDLTDGTSPSLGQASKAQFRLGAFGLVLAGRDHEALQAFSRRGRDSLSVGMARLLGGVTEGPPVEAKEIERLKALIDKEMIYPGLYQGVVDYLAARRRLRNADPAGASQLLAPLCERFPRRMVFQRELGLAYLRLGRLDLANIRLLLAIRLIDTHGPGPLRSEQRRALERAVVDQASALAGRSDMTDHWRLLRCLAPIAAEAPELARRPRSRRPKPMAELWEWSRLIVGAPPAVEKPSPGGAMTPQEHALLAAVVRALEDDSLESPRQIAVEDGSRDPTVPSVNRTLEATEIISEPVTLYGAGASVRYVIPALNEASVDHALLIRLRGATRQGTPGGCKVRVGADPYSVALRPEWNWNAFTLPPIITWDIEARITFHSSYITGFTEEGDPGDRDLYISRIVLLSLREERMVPAAPLAAQLAAVGRALGQAWRNTWRRYAP